MKINNKDISVEELVNNLNPRSNLANSNFFYLSDNQLQILKKYGFIVENYTNVKTLIFDIENYLNDNYDNYPYDLEYVASGLSEYNYYHTTNK